MRKLFVFVALTTVVASLSTWTLAQTGRGKRPKRATPAAESSRDGGPRAEREEPRGDAKGDGREAHEQATFQPDSGVVAARTLDGGAKVYRFGEMEIEGRLKSPQIVYFLRRVRAEFAADELGHRPFTQELSETRKEPAF